MKIVDIQGYAVGGNTFTDRHYEYLVYETPDYIMINGQPHTKDTLSPVFGKNLTIYNEYEFLCLDNYLGGVYSCIRNGNSSRSAGVWTSGPPSPTVNFGNNGQYNLLNENKLTRVWQSTYEPDFFYIWAMGASNQLWFYKINRHTMKIVQRSGGGSGDFYDGQPIFFHEDEEYLWGFVRPNNTSVNDHGQRIFYCEKSTLIFNWFGHINDGNRTSHLISANDKKFVTMTQWSNSASGVQFTVNLSSYTDTKSYSAASEYWKVDNPSHGNYPRVQMYKKNTETNEYEKTKDYLGVGASHEVFSDNEPFAQKSGNYISHGSALVHDYRNPSKDSLRKTHKIARWYSTYIDDQENFQFIRFNLSIDDDEALPAFDARKCTLSNPNNLELPRATTDSWGEDMPDLWLGSPTHSGRVAVMSAYFSSEDENHHYIIMSTEHHTAYNVHSPTNETCQKMYVFKIKNHTSSIVNNLHEDTSKELELVQVIKESGGTVGLLRPNNDPKTFIYFKGPRTDHSVYNWNQTKEEFVRVDTINGELLQAGTDSEGRIYTVNFKGVYSCEVELHTISLPNTISIEPEKNNYEYVGSPISSFVKVSAYNYLGQRIVANVDLQIVGSGVEFTDGGTKTTISTLNSADKQVGITIKSGATIQINASIGFADSGGNSASFILSNDEVPQPTTEVDFESETFTSTDLVDNSLNNVSNTTYVRNSSVVSSLISAKGEIISSSENWIKSTEINPGFIRLNFVESFFSQIPSVVVSVDHLSGIDNLVIEYNNLTKNSVDILFRENGQTNYSTTSQFTIMAQHQDSNLTFNETTLKKSSEISNSIIFSKNKTNNTLPNYIIVGELDKYTLPLVFIDEEFIYYELNNNSNRIIKKFNNISLEDDFGTHASLDTNNEVVLGEWDHTASLKDYIKMGLVGLNSGV